MSQVNYPKIIINGESTFNIKSFSMTLDGNGQIGVAALSVDDPIDVFTEMRQYAPTLTKLGTLITSIQVFDESNTKIYEDTTNSWTYDAISVQYLAFTEDNRQPNTVSVENRGMPLINLTMVEIED